MKKIVLITLLLSTGYGYGAECKQDEVMVATCTLPKNKSAVICVDQNNQTSYYSFKKGNTEELRVTFDAKKPLKRWLDTGPYTTYFGFRQNLYSYWFAVPEEKPDAKAFIVIQKNDQDIAWLSCKENSFGKKNITHQSIVDVPDEDVVNNHFIFP